MAFSGGKDSQALYHVAKLADVKFKAHFSPTTVDPPEVIRFIRTQYPDVEFGKVTMSIFDKAIEKGILPTQRVRWCCKEFKESAGAGKVTLIGIRKAESSRRAKRNEVEITEHKFSGDFEKFLDWRAEKMGKPSVANPELIDNETITGCIKGKDSILVSPIIYWTERDVWEFLNKQCIPHCKLYDEGWHRLGCICCPMASAKQKMLEIKMYPHIKRGWIRAIKEIRKGEVSSENHKFGEGAFVKDPNPHRWICNSLTDSPPQLQENAEELSEILTRDLSFLNNGLRAESSGALPNYLDRTYPFPIVLHLSAWWSTKKTKSLRTFSTGGYQEKDTSNGILTSSSRRRWTLKIRHFIPINKNTHVT